MLTQERHHEILELLNRQGAVSVTELAGLLAASESTIRRDLIFLDRQGKLQKVFGGATALRQSSGAFEADVLSRETRMSAEKDRIARYAATLIRDNDFIFIDAGTTTSRMVDYIENRNATYVTNGIAHALKLMKKGLNAFLVGGKIKAVTESAVGVETLKSLRNFNFTKAFLGTNGIDLSAGFTTPESDEAMVKEEAVARSYVSFVLSDHTKFRKVTAYTFSPLKKCVIITDELPDPAFAEETVIKAINA